MDNSEKGNAYHLGVEAAINGDTEADNPYLTRQDTDGGDMCESWLVGFESVESVQ